ncbi:M48 family metallopeptidase [Pedobacter sp. L105]|uniref:M48 family metallopeptidase n=1 Tax=Pedobacter sp. L105 TaxID=1641871 RepID=UPI001C208D45|nr:M48 family metallopeptidase [Pedobacter sp. L105]
MFVFTYLLLIVMGIGLILLCGLIAYGLIAVKFMIVTLMLGIGFLGMGFMIFFFLIKFVFSSPKKIDRSHLQKITEKQQPELFKLIHEIVDEVKTNFPKQVYLSADVNASVFYDSNFWSMFFPVRKNLQIGIGLMNAVSAIELKAVLAHEFGHFSQRSMKVGSYVYNMNKVIYNMLYDNENYNLVLNRWSNVSSYFVLFSRGAILIIHGIQYVLISVYKILNLNYMALSREMEFHADAVAASVTGSAPLASSLLRLGLADQSLSIVFKYYNAKIAASQKTLNFYPQQYFVLNHIAATENLPIEDGLPKVSMEVYNKVKKTRLVLEDQWSSHPSIEERVAKLMSLNLPLQGEYGGIAINMLVDQTLIQEAMTARLFEKVTYETNPEITGSKEFIDEYIKLEEESSYPPVYKGYFDSRNPYIGFTADDFEQVTVSGAPSIEQLFDDHTMGELSNLNNSISDKGIMERISNGSLEIKTFDYNGKKYSAADTYNLIRYVEDEIRKYEELFRIKDIKIFECFLAHASQQRSMEGFKERAMAYQAVAARFGAQEEAYINLIGSTYFMHTTTTFDDIRNNLFLVKKYEVPFKKQVKLILESDIYQADMDVQMKLHFEEYISNDWKYFADKFYFDQEIRVLFSVMAGYYTLVSQVHFKLKKAFLTFILHPVPEIGSEPMDRV